MSGRPALAPVHEVRAVPSQFTIFGGARAWQDAVERLTPMIDKVARALAGADEQFREDLVQEGHIAIWDLDPSRFDAEGEHYLRRAVAVRMRLAARRERVQSKRRRVGRKRVREAMDAATNTGTPTQPFGREASHALADT